MLRPSLPPLTKVRLSMSDRPRWSTPRKAYRAILPARVEKYVLIWADSATDAVERFYASDKDNIAVMDNEFFEGKLTRPKRERSGDRDA